MMRRLGRSNIQVSALGLGTARVGGIGWSLDYSRDLSVQHGESIRAIHRALDLGVNYFDSADEYGAGVAESLLGRALAGASRW